MEEVYVTDKIFENFNFRSEPLLPGSYENCTFLNGDLSGSDFSEIKFIDCHFEGCNLCLVKISDTAFRNVIFIECKVRKF